MKPAPAQMQPWTGLMMHSNPPVPSGKKKRRVFSLHKREAVAHCTRLAGFGSRPERAVKRPTSLICHHHLKRLPPGLATECRSRSVFLKRKKSTNILPVHIDCWTAPMPVSWTRLSRAFAKRLTRRFRSEGLTATKPALTQKELRRRRIAPDRSINRKLCKRFAKNSPQAHADPIVEAAAAITSARLAPMRRRSIRKNGAVSGIEKRASWVGLVAA